MFVSTNSICAAKKGTSPVRSHLNFTPKVTNVPLSSHCFVGMFGEYWEFKEIFLSRKISNVIQNQSVYPESANHHLASLSIDVLSYLLHPNLPFYLFIF